MKFSEFINEEKEVNLIGMMVNDRRLITPETANGHWQGEFNCRHRSLSSLKGAPKMVNGDFDCVDNELETLKGAPEIVTGSFDCSNNKLTTLEGAPRKIGNYFSCRKNQLSSLKGSPAVIKGTFDCSDNKLTSLEGIPEKVGNCYISGNILTSLVGAPKIINGDFGCENNKLISLKDIHKIINKINGGFHHSGNPIKSHVLGLLLIDGLNEVTGHHNWSKILNRYLGKGRKGMLDCQNELIDMGLEEYAQL